MVWESAMKPWSFRLLYLVPFLSLGWAPAAHAQWAVIDVASINQLIQEVSILRQELTTAEQQLSQARSEYAAITGNRGMDQLLSGQNLNYLPTDWAQVQGVLAGSGGVYGTLASSVQSQVAANAVLTPQQVAALSSTEQAQLQADRSSTALLQAMTQQALSMTSARFTSLQQLIAAIPRATDQKGALDLQARISAEETMLQNDEVKMGVLYQLSRAQSQANDERAREQAISDIGSFRDLPPLQF
jgi:type IV secretion system protein VirB5